MSQETLTPKVYFVGAGPGDPELLTLKAKRLLEEADLLIYAGSLVPDALLQGLKAEKINSHRRTLEELVSLMINAAKAGKKVVRLHSGDPAFYSAIAEQIRPLRQAGILVEVVPGVSSATAGAARLAQELTLPEVSQTVIFTRLGGRTPVPERESLHELARHQATMVIFLSVGMAERVQEELLKGGYPEDTPVVVLEKISRPDERILRTRLSALAEEVQKAGIKRTALIYVGKVFAQTQELSEKRSYLYGPEAGER